MSARGETLGNREYNSRKCKKEQEAILKHIQEREKEIPNAMVGSVKRPDAGAGTDMWITWWEKGWVKEKDIPYEDLRKLVRKYK